MLEVPQINTMKLSSIFIYHNSFRDQPIRTAREIIRKREKQRSGNHKTHHLIL